MQVPRYKMYFPNLDIPTKEVKESFTKIVGLAGILANESPSRVYAAWEE